MTRRRTPTIEQRSWSVADLELRSDRRQFDALLVPYDVPSPMPVAEKGRLFTETVSPGAFTRSVQSFNARTDRRLPLLLHHDLTRVAGSAMMLAEDKRGVVGTFEVSNTADGVDALEQLELRSLRPSVGMLIHASRWATPDHRVISEARLHEVSLVTVPVHDTQVLAVREATGPIEPWRRNLASRRLELMRKPL